MPDFSIIMPCYNAEKSLDAAINSVLEQTSEAWELICINDGSIDGTSAKLDAWAKRDARIRIHHIENRGPAVARNFGAAQATGDILCFLDADDLWVASKLTELTDVFANPVVGGAFGVVSFFDILHQEVTRSTVPNAPLTIPLLMGENPVCTMSNFSLRRRHFVKHGGLAQGFVHNEDLEWLIRLVGLDVVIQPIATQQVWYRRSTGGLSADLFAMAQSRRQALRTARYFGFDPKPSDEAQYQRYLARRALRLDQGASVARTFALRGLYQSPAGFLTPPRRGLPTAIAALIAPALPQSLRCTLFT